MAALTEEQSILKDQAASWVEAELPVQKFREFRNSNSDGGFDPKAWAAMVDMGLDWHLGAGCLWRFRPWLYDIWGHLRAIGSPALRIAAICFRLCWG